ALHLVVHVALGQCMVAAKIDAIAAHPLANLLGDDGDGLRHPVIMNQSARTASRLSTGTQTLTPRSAASATTTRCDSATQRARSAAERVEKIRCTSAANSASAASTIARPAGSSRT